MSEMESRVDRMARAARDPVVVLHKFNKLRSQRPEQLVLVVEGDEDPIFYSVIAQRCGVQDDFLALVAGGKDLVLGFRELLKVSLEAKRGAGVAFAVERLGGVARRRDLVIALLRGNQLALAARAAVLEPP